MPFLKGLVDKCAISNCYEGIIYICFRILLYNELIKV